MIPKEELRWYLFEETIEMFSKNGRTHYEEHRYKDLNRFLSDYYIIRSVGLAAKICYKTSKAFNKQKNDILVHDLLCRYPSIISALERHYNPILFGINIKPFYKSLPRKIDYYPLYDIYKVLYRGVLDYDNDLIIKSYHQLESVVKKINPKLIVFNHDFTTDVKLMTLVASELGVPTVEIQHGMYSGKDRVLSGNNVDYVFVWGKYFQDFYLNSPRVKDRKIKVLGYPYSVIPENHADYQKKVVYLGQPMEIYDNSYLNKKKEIIIKLNDICEDLGFELVYRKHLNEDLAWLKKNLPGVKFTTEGETLTETIKNNDIFISFNSTALIESALNNKISIQLINYDIPTDDFEELGICRSFTSLIKLKEFLKELKSHDDVKRLYNPVNPDYIEIPSPNPGAKFVELVEDIV